MKSKQYFDKVANNWDTMQESFFSEAVREKSFAMANAQKGKIAADIGAGTGFITRGLIERGINVIAVDQSEAMLTEMKKKFKGIDTIDYRAGTSEDLPVDDNSVDYVFANMYLHHVENPAKSIKELARILKHDGKLVITDLAEHNFKFLKDEQFDLWMGFKRADIQKWFGEAGLKNINIDCVGEDCCSKCSCGNESAIINIFAAYGEK